MNEKLKRMLGLARKAGCLKFGASAAEFSIKSKKCRLLLLAGDCGGSTKDKFVHLCEIHGIKCVILSDKKSLGTAVGFPEKAVIAVENEDFAAGMKSAATDTEVVKYGESENQ